MHGKTRVLFVCSGPGVRGRIAEAILNYKYPQLFEAKSARFDEARGQMSPFILSLMAETNIMLPKEFPVSVFERQKNNETFDYVITLCNSSTKFECPIFKSNVDFLYKKEAQRIGWAIQDFRSIGHLPETQKMDAARAIRELIHREVDTFAGWVAKKQLAA